MYYKYRTFAVSAIIVLIFSTNLSLAVDVRMIEQVRQKGVLDSSDLQIIDQFLADAVKELVNTRDYSAIEKTRRDILANSSSATESAAAQYAMQFSLSARKYIEQGIELTEQITGPRLNLLVTTNLLILIDSMEDPALAPLAIKKLNDNRNVIQYWAVHCLTNPGIIKQLKKANTDNPELAEQITQSLRQLLKEKTAPEIVTQIAQYAAAGSTASSEQLLMEIADVRIKKYESWSVRNELLDVEILLLIHQKLEESKKPNPLLLRRFAQLYSCAIQRYLKAKPFLDPENTQQLISVLAEVEQSCISKLLQIPQSVIKKTIENDDIAALQQEHDRLLGSPAKAGKLNDVVKFNYGMTETGDPRTWPLTLPEPPEEIVAK